MFKKLLLMVSVFLLPALLSAGTGGKLVGKVTDRETGEALPGANVVITGTLLGSATDADGEFIILNVPVGTYSLKASFIGYQTVTISDVRVHLDLTTEINFGLPSETLELSEISIVAERPLVNKNATNSISIKSAEDIQVLPLRGFRNVISIDAGVTSVAGRTYVRGGRREEVATYIDGVYQNLPLTGRASGDIANNAIEEVNFQAGGFNAEYGFANSGVINVTSKSGGANYNVTGEVITDAWLSKKDKRLGTYGYGYNVYSIALSGPTPFMGDKVKFYVGLERQDRDDFRPSSFAYQALKMDADGNPLNAAGQPITFADTASTANVQRGINLDDAFPTYDFNGDGVQSYQWDEQGPWPNRGSQSWLWNANITIDASANMKFKIGGNSSRQDLNDLAGFSPGADFANNLNGAGIGFTLWNSENNPRQQSWQDSYFAKLTHTLGDRTFYTFQVNYFRDDLKLSSEQFGDAFWNIADKDDQISEFGPGSDGITNPYIEDLGTRPSLDPRSAQLFSSLGTQPARYYNRRWSFWGVKGDITHQLDKIHEFKAGLEYRYNTYKSYDIGGYGSADLHTLAGSLINVDPNDPNAITAEQAYQARFADPFGFDIFGQEGSFGARNQAKNPVIASAYLQDKVELEDLVVNIGVRWDYFDPANDGIVDVEHVTTTTDPGLGGVNVISEDNFKGNQTKSTISPRLGFSFPVTDRTVFHAQYGKFVQTPELVRLYASTVGYGQNLQSGNFFTQENPNLDLVKTTSYEIGFRQQIGDNSALDVTAYYKEIINYVRLTQLDNAVPVPYAIYTSQDYGTVKGLTFTYNMRPVSRVSASANYTLQYAAGTGSDANTLYNIAWQGGRTPTFVAPLDFDQRHTGSANFDFRSKPEDTFGRWGLNALLTFSSGLSYTPVRAQTEVLGGTSGYFPIAQVGSAQGPWTYQLDLKLDKTFSIGESDLVVYLWAINVTNAFNSTWVYPGTGEADNDGYFDTVAGKDWLKTWGENGRELYNFLLRDPYMAGPPRQFRLGLRLEM